VRAEASAHEKKMTDNARADTFMLLDAFEGELTGCHD
jgi:hypothetical protein